MNKMREYLNKAYNEHFSIPAFNFENFDVLKGIALGAAKANSPVIVQTTMPALEELGIENIVHFVEYYNHLYEISLLLHLDHADSIDIIKQCITLGYKSIMIDMSEKDYSFNEDTTKDVVEYAHRYDAIVEGEVGIVGSEDLKSQFTDISLAKHYAKITKVDTLAVSIGNLHGGREKVNGLNTSLLKEIYLNTDIPLVLHGSSGVVNSDLKIINDYGICKINIETELRMLYRKSLENFLDTFPDEIKTRKISHFVQQDICDFVYEKCANFGSVDKA